jgi:IS30 family transposase
MIQRIPGEPVGREEEEEIIRLLSQGLSQHAVSRQLARSQSTISKVAREAGVEGAHRPPKIALGARRRQARQRRTEIRE